MHRIALDGIITQKLLSIKDTMQSGNKEYANSEDAFANFNRLSSSLKIDRKKVLLVYLTKHIDGILSYINGHKSQREHVGGRIEDAIVYLLLLYGMIIEEEKEGEEEKVDWVTPLDNYMDQVISHDHNDHE